MLDFAVNLEAVDQVVGDLPWAIGMVAVMVAVGVILTWIAQRQSGQREGKHT
jgi:hypothetical protein